MNKVNSIQIPINIFDNIIDEIVYTFITTLHLLFFLGLMIMFGINDHFTLSLSMISGLLFSLTFIITPGITYFYSNSILYIDKDGFRIKKYGREILFISYQNLLGVRVMKHEMKSNTYFEMYLNYNEYQVVDYTINNTQKFRIQKKNFKSANQFYNIIDDYFKSNPQIAQVWHQNV